MAAQQKMDYRLLNRSVNQQVDQQGKAYSFISHIHTHTHTTKSIKQELCLNLHFPAAHFVPFHKHTAQPGKGKRKCQH